MMLSSAGPGSPGRPGTGELRQFGHDRVIVAGRLDHDPGGDRGHVGVRVERVRRQGQRTGIPPGVVVAECDVGGGDPAQGEIAADGPEIGAGRDQRDRRVMPADVGGAAVGGPVVDHDDGRALRQVLQPVQGAGQLGSPVVGDHRHGDPGVGFRLARAASSRRMSASTWAGSGRRRSRATGSRSAVSASARRASRSRAAARASRAVGAGRARKRPAQPGHQHAVAQLLAPPPRGVANRRRPVMDDDVGAVDDAASAGRPGRRPAALPRRR